MSLKALATSCILALSSPVFGEGMPDVIWRDLLRESPICSAGMCKIEKPEISNGRTVILIRDYKHGDVDLDRSKVNVLTGLGVKVIGVEGLSDDGGLLNGEVELVRDLQADSNLTIVPLEDPEAQRRALFFLIAIIENQRIKYDAILQGCRDRDDRIENCTGVKCDDVQERFPDLLEKLRQQIQIQISLLGDDLDYDATVVEAFSVAGMDVSLRHKPDDRSYCGWYSDLVEMSISHGPRSESYRRIVESDRENVVVVRIKKAMDEMGLNAMAVLFGVGHEEGLVKLLTQEGYTVICF